MTMLTVQPASSEVLHMYGAFSINDPARLCSLPGLKNAYLVPTRGEQGCLVVEPDVALTVRHARSIERLVYAIARHLGYSQVQLMRGVERKDGGVAETVYDWAKLR